MKLMDDIMRVLVWFSGICFGSVILIYAFIGWGAVEEEKARFKVFHCFRHTVELRP